MNDFLTTIDWEHVLSRDHGLSVVVVSADGKILFASPGAFALFGADSEMNVVGRHWGDYFHDEFVQERRRWIREALETNSILRVSHVYQGRRLQSTLIPMTNAERRGVTVVTRQESYLASQGADRTVSSEYVDLGELSVLTNRELEIFVMLGQGLSVPEVAKLLHRSPRTVERHKEAIGKKLGLSSIAAIATAVREAGLQMADVTKRRFNALRPEYVT